MKEERASPRASPEPHWQRRVHGVLGVIDTGEAQRRYDRTAGWVARLVASTGNLLARYATVGAGGASEPMVLARAPMRPSDDSDAGGPDSPSPWAGGVHASPVAPLPALSDAFQTMRDASPASSLLALRLQRRLDVAGALRGQVATLTGRLATSGVAGAALFERLSARATPSPPQSVPLVAPTLVARSQPVANSSFPPSPGLAAGMRLGHGHAPTLARRPADGPPDGTTASGAGAVRPAPGSLISGSMRPTAAGGEGAAHSGLPLARRAEMGSPELPPASADGAALPLRSATDVSETAGPAATGAQTEGPGLQAHSPADGLSLAIATVPPSGPAIATKQPPVLARTPSQTRLPAPALAAGEAGEVSPPAARTAPPAGTDVDRPDAISPQPSVGPVQAVSETAARATFSGLPLAWQAEVGRPELPPASVDRALPLHSATGVSETAEPGVAGEQTEGPRSPADSPGDGLFPAIATAPPSDTAITNRQLPVLARTLEMAAGVASAPPVLVWRRSGELGRHRVERSTGAIPVARSVAASGPDMARGVTPAPSVPGGDAGAATATPLPTGMDLLRLADQVARLIARNLVVERERRGGVR